MVQYLSQPPWTCSIAPLGGHDSQVGKNRSRPPAVLAAVHCRPCILPVKDGALVEKDLLCQVSAQMPLSPILKFTYMCLLCPILDHLHGPPYSY